jgi:hypothetical protein
MAVLGPHAGSCCVLEYCPHSKRGTECQAVALRRTAARRDAFQEPHSLATRAIRHTTSLNSFISGNSDTVLQLI